MSNTLGNEGQTHVLYQAEMHNWIQRLAYAKLGFLDWQIDSYKVYSDVKANICFGRPVYVFVVDSENAYQAEGSDFPRTISHEFSF